MSNKEIFCVIEQNYLFDDSENSINVVMWADGLQLRTINLKKYRNIIDDRENFIYYESGKLNYYFNKKYFHYSDLSFSMGRFGRDPIIFVSFQNRSFMSISLIEDYLDLDAFKLFKEYFTPEEMEELKLLIQLQL